jgi:hypothetical protein
MELLCLKDTDEGLDTWWDNLHVEQDLLMYITLYLKTYTSVIIIRIVALAKSNKKPKN